ncbi:MAG: NUDIX domain-containing protein, partial [Cyanobacteriota bacterium]|nr:NUDIX domain-containing protein [Cyanobacteriota bacterium]
NVPESISAGGIVVRQDDKDNVWVAAVEEVHKSDRPECVLPKGHLEAGETIEEAARREIEEEAGLTDLTLLAELGALERLDFKKRAWKVTHYFLYQTQQVDGKPTDLHRDYQLRWFPLDELPAFFWPEQRKLIETNRDLIRQSVLKSET